MNTSLGSRGSPRTFPPAGSRRSPGPRSPACAGVVDEQLLPALWSMCCSPHALTPEVEMVSTGCSDSRPSARGPYSSQSNCSIAPLRRSSLTIVCNRSASRSIARVRPRRAIALQRGQQLAVGQWRSMAAMCRGRIRRTPRSWGWSTWCFTRNAGPTRMLISAAPRSGSLARCVALTRGAASSPEICRASELPLHHRDPFDSAAGSRRPRRATATILTSDEAIHHYPVSCRW